MSAYCRPASSSMCAIVPGKMSDQSFTPTNTTVQCGHKYKGYRTCYLINKLAEKLTDIN